MNKMAKYVSSAVLALCLSAHANQKKQDLLIKLAPGFVTLEVQGAKVEKLNDSWVRVQGSSAINVQALQENPAVAYVQPNYKIKLLEDFSIHDPLQRAALKKMMNRRTDVRDLAIVDNPAIPDAPQ
ncbi:MAG: S8 family peptidase, partial [Bdellovibrio sp.]